jgi:hypothetical protein
MRLFAAKETVGQGWHHCSSTMPRCFSSLSLAHLASRGSGGGGAGSGAFGGSSSHGINPKAHEAAEGNEDNQPNAIDGEKHGGEHRQDNRAR